MSEGFVDPMEVAADDYLKAADLKNQVCLIHPTGTGSEPGTKPDSDGVIRQWEYVICDVATLDRSGIVQFSDGVRISWRRPRLALSGQIGEFVGGKFAQAEGSTALELLPLTGDARKAAASNLDEFRSRIGGAETEVPPVDEDGFSEEPLETF